MTEKELDYRLDKDVARVTPVLLSYQRKNGIIDTQLGKIERLKRPLVTRISVLRAVSHDTDCDKSPEADEYRAHVLIRCREAYEEYMELLKEEEEYVEYLHKVNHDFVEEIINKYRPQ